ncbi:MAG: hypothetical protein IJ149_09050 [Oscillospiraceae bacterium]|nr:hypothetical protein [Oscillospiraceae bacterium]
MDMKASGCIMKPVPRQKVSFFILHSAFKGVAFLADLWYHGMKITGRASE